MSRPEQVHRLVDPAMVPPTPSDRHPAPQAAASADLPPALAAGGAHVGRDGLLRLLQHRWAEVETGAAHAVFVGGEPGIGKTSLAGELARRVHLAGARVLYGRCDEHARIAYQPLLDPVRAALAAVHPDGPAPDADLAGRLLAAAAAPASAATEIDAERYVVFEAITELFASAGRACPTLLVLDDLHWAGAPTAQLVGHLVRQAPARVLLVATYREHDVGPDHPMRPVLAEAWRLAHVDRLGLAGLAADGTVALLEHLAQHDLDADGRSLAEALREATGGNPFFMREVVRHLVDSGVLVRQGARWSTTLDVGAVDLPQSVRDVLELRLAGLHDDARSVLRVAAVAGPTIDVGLLEEVLGVDDDRVLDAVDDGVEAGLVVDEDGAGPRFAHALVREVLRAQLGGTRRRRWHRRVADALAARPAATRPVELIAHHYGEASVDDPVLGEAAARFGLEACRRSTAAAAHEEALAHAERALEALARCPAADPLLRCDLLLSAAAAMFAVAGRTDACRVPALEAGTIAARAGDPERVAAAAELALGGLVMTYDTSRELATIEQVRSLPTSPAVRARLLAAEVLARAGAGRGGEDQLSVDAVELGRRSGDAVALAAGLHARSAVLVRSPDLGERRRVAEELAAVRGLEPSTATRVALSPTDVEIHRSAIALAAGELDVVRRQVELLESLHADTGHWELRYFAIALRASLATVAGDLDDLDRWAGEMMEHDAARPPDPTLATLTMEGDGSSIGNNPIRLFAAYQFLLCRERGTLTDILDLFRQAVAADPHIPSFGAALAIAEADVGLLSDASATLHRTVAGGLDALPHDQMLPLCLGALCEAAALTGDRDLGAALRERVQPYAGQIAVGGNGTIVFDLFDRVLGMLHLAEGRLDDAVEHLDRASERAAELGARVFEARARAWAALAHRRRGDAEDARCHGDRARDLADELGLSGLSTAVRRLVER